MYRDKKIGVVVPCFNEAFLIKDTLMGMPDFVNRIYVVDDKSTDNSAEIIIFMMNQDSRIHLCQHTKNQGVGAAIITGYKKALEENMDIIAIMAGDNQMNPYYLPNLIDPIIKNQTDITKGNRLKRGYWKGMPFFRRFGNLVLSLITKLVTGYWKINDPQNGYVVINAQSLRKIDLDSLYRGYAFENDLMLKANVANLRMKNVLIPAVYGEEKSKIKYGRFIFKTSFFLMKSYFWRLWKKYLKTFRPIGFVFILGICAVITGIIIGSIYTFKVYWPILIVGILLLFIGQIADGLKSSK
ncbi:MAG: glycosyltransferase family 2 protein [Candidatus Heimdallarchaeota archaeon]|nr:glycosyltransferase family 2 protein [Candidatus Heimdallarchaeota archaeon]